MGSNVKTSKEYGMKASRKALLLGLAIAAGGIAAPTIASAGVVVDIDVAPPPVRVEAVPEPRVGFVWAPGFWEWRGGAHVWVPRHYIPERRGLSLGGRSLGSPRSSLASRAGALGALTWA